MTDVFRWKVLARPQGAVQYSVLAARFGDGFRQTAPNGINNKTQNWTVQIQGTLDELAQPIAFLDALAGARSFFWTPPGGQQGYYKAGSFQPVQIAGPLWSLTIPFEQDFKP